MEQNWDFYDTFSCPGSIITLFSPSGLPGPQKQAETVVYIAFLSHFRSGNKTFLIPIYPTMRTHLRLHSILYPGLLLALVSTTISCKKDALADAGTSSLTPASVVAADAAQQLAIVNSSWQVNWNKYADGVYPATAAVADFGNAGSWVNNRAWISAGSLRRTVLPNRLSD